jgi:hypothetical protein
MILAFDLGIIAFVTLSTTKGAFLAIAESFLAAFYALVIADIDKLAYCTCLSSFLASFRMAAPGVFKLTL